MPRPQKIILENIDKSLSTLSKLIKRKKKQIYERLDDVNNKLTMNYTKKVEWMKKQGVNRNMSDGIVFKC